MTIYREGMSLVEVSKAAWSLIPRTQARIAGKTPVGTFTDFTGRRATSHDVHVDVRRKPSLVGHLRGKKTRTARVDIPQRNFTAAEAAGGWGGGGGLKRYGDKPKSEAKAIFNQRLKQEKFAARQQRRDSRWS